MILFFILLVAGISTYFKYFSEYEKAIDKFVFIASTARFIIMFLILVFSNSNAMINNIVVIWVLYLAAILFYFIKDEEYKFSYFLLFIGANTIGSIIVLNTFEEICILSMYNRIGIMIAAIFFVIMIGLGSGFFYQFF